MFTGGRTGPVLVGIGAPDGLPVGDVVAAGGQSQAPPESQHGTDSSTIRCTSSGMGCRSSTNGHDSEWPNRRSSSGSVGPKPLTNSQLVTCRISLPSASENSTNFAMLFELESDSPSNHTQKVSRLS